MLAAGLVFAGVACNRGAATGPSPTDTEIEGVPAVVQMVATRDGLNEASAEDHVQQIAWLAAAARAELDGRADPPPLMTPARARFVRRGALARLWMHETFEPAHGVDAIADDDPILLRALASAKHVRPRLTMLCQVAAVPAGIEDRDALVKKAEDPQWQATTKARIDAIADRLQRYVRPSDPQACRLMGKLMRYEDKDDGIVKLTVESKAFNLDACLREDSSGACLEPQWAPEWVAKVRPRTDAGFIPPFRTRFGYHVVFVVQVLEPAPADDPATQARARDAILGPWRAASYDAELDRLRKKWAVKVVTGSGAPR